MVKRTRIYLESLRAISALTSRGGPVDVVHHLEPRLGDETRAVANQAASMASRAVALDCAKRVFFGSVRKFGLV